MVALSFFWLNVAVGSGGRTAPAGQHQEVNALATPNYSYEKRQRELAKKRKAEEKRQKKLGRVGDGPADDAAGGAPVEQDGGANPAPPPRPAE